MNKIDKRTDPRGGTPGRAMSLHYADIEPPRFASHTEPPPREGTPGRHKPRLCRHKSPRFARQTKHAQSLQTN